ncbi:MAG: hypothetical protein WB608_19615 [Terracidiphilus sp.]
MNGNTDIAGYEALGALSEDELLFQLGAAIRPIDLGAGRPSRGDIVRRAKQWLQIERPSIAKLICNDARVVAFRTGDHKDQYDLFVVVCDCVSSLHGGLPIATIGMLILRLGLNNLCGELQRP